MTPSSINNLFFPALLSTPSGSRWHISSLEPQTGAKDEPNLLAHLSLFLCLHLFNSPRLWILFTHTQAYTYTCSEARLSEVASLRRQESRWNWLREEAPTVSSVTCCCVVVTVGFWLFCLDTYAACVCAYCLFTVVVLCVMSMCAGNIWEAEVTLRSG